MPQKNGHSNEYFYVGTVDLAEESKGTSRIEILKTGKVHDRNLTITTEMLDDFVKNFEARTVGTEIQVNLRHDRGGEAAGWVRKLERVEDRLFAEVEWTPLGVEKVKSKQYRFTSSELAGSFPHHETGKPVKNVLIGVALTNIPAVKGLEAVTLSESAQTFINNHEQMDKFKTMLASLLAKETVELSEVKELAKLADEAVEAGELDAEEAKTSVEEVEAKVEGEEEGGEEEEAEEEAPEEPAKEEAPEPAPAAALSEKAPDLSKLSERVNALAEENKALMDKITLSELSEEVKDNLCLSESNGRSTGFKADKETVGRVANFMLSLSQDQRAEFKELLSAHQTVDFSERGVSAGTSAVSHDLSEGLKKANVEATKRHAANSDKPLHDHLSDVMVEMGLVD